MKSKNYYKCNSPILLLLLTILTLTACDNANNIISQESWGTVNNKEVSLYTLTNSKGMVMKLTNYGGIITSLLVPDKDGNLDDVVLGFDNLDQYLEKNPCFGATIGRFANRIRDGRFVIEGVTYNLEKNDGIHCIHGGNEFNTAVWDAEKIKTETGQGIRLHHISTDGEMGFPGNLDVYVTYILTEENEVHVTFEATTDKVTHVSLTQHSYFNLNGCKELIYDHLIKIDADNYTEIDDDVVPTGVISSVKGKDWDLTNLTRMGDNIHKLDKGGYHYCYVFNKKEGEFKKVIEVIEPNSGRKMEVSTTQPGVQFYSGNNISTSLVGKNRIRYGSHIAFCLETQHFPDSPNHPNFPSTLLYPEEKYEEVVVYGFGVK